MASPVNALVCALIATAFWSLLGYALGSRLVPRVLAIGAAPVIGWSVHSAAYPADLFVVWIFAFRRGRYRRSLRSGRWFFVVAAALGR